MDAKLAGKKEQLQDVTELLEHDGYQILAAEFERKKQEGIAAACNVKLSQSERDAGAGVKVAMEQLLDFLPQKKRSLESTVKTATSRKRQTQ